MERQSISEIYASGIEIMEKKGLMLPGGLPPDSKYGSQVKANRDYLDSLYFITKHLDCSEADTGLTLFGIKLKTPIYAASIGVHPVNKFWEDFWNYMDVTKLARGVNNAGAMMMVGACESEDLQKIIDTGVPTVRIIKPFRDSDLILRQILEAEKRGCVAVGMDIDNYWGTLLPGGTRVNPGLVGPHKTSELRQFRSQTKLPFVIKGVLSTADAQKAVEIGAAAIIVSNHGRQMIDFSVPSMIALPEIVESVGKKVAIMVDTGFKIGNDVLKALAFGAKAVGFGTSMLIALASNGENGVESLIYLLNEELRRTMSATGCSNLTAINKSILVQTNISSVRYFTANR
jgi:4-hydroxymandelate oxidase